MPTARLLAPALASLLFTLPAVAQPKADPADRVPVLKPLWKVTTVGRPLQNYVEIDEHPWLRGGRETKASIAERLARVTGLYESALAARMTAGRPLIPPSRPSAIDDLVLYQSDEGVVARALRPREQEGEQYQTSDIFWIGHPEYSLIECACGYGKWHALKAWMNQYPKDAVAEQVWSHTLGHALTVQADAVVIPDSLPLMPPPPKPENPRPAFGLLEDVVYSGSLRQFRLDSGKLYTRLGPADVKDTRPPFPLPASKAKAQPLPGIRFVSVPLAGTDGLTLVTERDRSLWVTRLDLERFTKFLFGKGQFNSGRAHREALTSEAAWETELMVGPTSVVDDPYRRIHAIHLVETNGLVICPTHLGRVIAVEAKSGKAKWTHEYAPLSAKRFPTFAPEWVVVPPVVADGRYVYAPADFPELLCLDAATGEKVWTAKKGDGLYPAIVGDKVLVVGEKAVRALSLKDGSEVWKLDLTGLPCGRGVVLGNDYLVPVSEPKTWKGMIAVIDVKAGKVREVLKPAADEPIGNLVVHQDYLVSQTLTELAVFPLKKR